jgi:hypothetical protein
MGTRAACTLSAVFLAIEAICCGFKEAIGELLYCSDACVDAAQVMKNVVFEADK